MNLAGGLPPKPRKLAKHFTTIGNFINSGETASHNTSLARHLSTKNVIQSFSTGRKGGGHRRGRDRPLVGGTLTRTAAS